MTMIIENPTTTQEEMVLQALEHINGLEINLIRGKLDHLLPEIEKEIDVMLNRADEMEPFLEGQHETLFYNRLLRAKCEEIFDIIEMKQAK